jgi:hypothetical protein
MLLRLLIFAVIIGIVYFGIRKIIADWRGRFEDLDQQTHERDLKERQRPDVVELKRDKDGVFRPGDGDHD